MVSESRSLNNFQKFIETVHITGFSWTGDKIFTFRDQHDIDPTLIKINSFAPWNFTQIFQKYFSLFIISFPVKSCLFFLVIFNLLNG
jgi:hypothetical protein